LSLPDRRPASVEDRLEKHLAAWLGAWPPPPGRVLVVGTPIREAPGWDGRARAVLGVSTRDGAVVSVTPALAAEMGALPKDVDVAEVGTRLSRLAGGRLYAGAFRWCESPTPFEDAGVWVPREDERVPEWLKPFNGDVLVAFDPASGAYLAGVGVKRHDDFGHELSVGTEPEAQGRGLARRLVAQAARRVIAGGAVPTYLHDFANAASAKVAAAAGFPDHGWRVLGMGP
jgi:GNAT superfamily N-acetyltransferase